jgi:hypothetical protein
MKDKKPSPGLTLTPEGLVVTPELVQLAEEILQSVCREAIQNNEPRIPILMALSVYAGREFPLEEDTHSIDIITEMVAHLMAVTIGMHYDWNEIGELALGRFARLPWFDMGRDAA